LSRYTLTAAKGGQSHRNRAEVPNSLADLLAATTGPDSSFATADNLMFDLGSTKLSF
jgi:hypothetical protein